MKPIFLLFGILFPIISGVILAISGTRSVKKIRIWVGSTTVLTSVCVWLLILFGSYGQIDMIQFTRDFTFTLRFDRLGRFFAGIVATLWPLTVFYGFEYLKDDARQHVFFTFFSIAYGVTLGITMSGSIFTMYCFYELLTLSTAPLVMHTKTKEAIRAARDYFAFSIGGAAFALVSVLYLSTGGPERFPEEITRLFYVLGFFGFGVKSAIFPLHKWLPEASVAPTPVTALLHAVAVVKSGVFAVIRLTFFGYDRGILKGSFAQLIPMIFVIFTILYGSSKALKETHWKRRLAYSTVANLSYILFGVLLMTDEGLMGGLLHMAFHAEIKILAFFAAGAVLHQTGREYLCELDGLGRKMPIVFGCFTVSALALVGIPPFSGFLSKWSLLTAAANDGTAVAYVGAGAILISALLTAIYMLTVVRRAFFPDREVELRTLDHVKDAGLLMLIPMIILAVGILLTGLFGGAVEGAALQIVTTLVRW